MFTIDVELNSICSDIPPTINGGSILYSAGTANNRSRGTVAIYGSSDVGYTLNGGNIRTCQGDGTWSGSNSTCEREVHFRDNKIVNVAIVLIACTAVSCGPPPSIPNGHIDSSTGTTFGEMTTYNCDRGFYRRYYRTLVTTCQANGMREDLPTQCVKRGIALINRDNTT